MEEKKSYNLEWAEIIEIKLGEDSQKKKKPGFPCKICKNVYKSLEYLQIHMEMHSVEKPR